MTINQSIPLQKEQCQYTTAYSRFPYLLRKKETRRYSRVQNIIEQSKDNAMKLYTNYVLELCIKSSNTMSIHSCISFLQLYIIQAIQLYNYTTIQIRTPSDGKESSTTREHDPSGQLEQLK